MSPRSVRSRSPQEPPSSSSDGVPTDFPDIAESDFYCFDTDDDEAASFHGEPDSLPNLSDIVVDVADPRELAELHQLQQPPDEMFTLGLTPPEVDSDVWVTPQLPPELTRRLQQLRSRQPGAARPEAEADDGATDGEEAKAATAFELFHAENEVYWEWHRGLPDTD